MKFKPKINVLNTKSLKVGVEVKRTFHKRIYETKLPKAKKSKKSLFKQTFSKSAKNFYFPDTKDRRQFCTTKVSFRKTKDLHLKNLIYIQKEGKALDGTKPILYGSDTEGEYKSKMDEQSWRIILSPKNNDVPLELLARKFIEKLERDKGYKLSWVAANHYDTNHHHVHILINGKDKHGKRVNFLPKEYVKEVMRNHARDLCTSFVGGRSDDDITKEYEECIEKQSLTILDKRIKKYIDENNLLNKNYLNDRYANIINDRLDYLEKNNLCKWSKKNLNFSFTDGWDEKLKTYGKYDTYLDAFNKSGAEEKDFYLHDLKKENSIEGKIIGKYTMQKDSNNFALVIQTKENKVAYVPLPFYPKNCFIGDTIKIEKNEKNRANIKNFTRKNFN